MRLWRRRDRLSNHYSLRGTHLSRHLVDRILLWGWGWRCLLVVKVLLFIHGLLVYMIVSMLNTRLARDVPTWCHLCFILSLLGPRALLLLWTCLVFIILSLFLTSLLSSWLLLMSLLYIVATFAVWRMAWINAGWLAGSSIAAGSRTRWTSFLPMRISLYWRLSVMVILLLILLLLFLL